MIGRVKFAEFAQMFGASDIISKCGVGLVIHQIGKAKSEKEGALLA